MLSESRLDRKAQAHEIRRARQATPWITEIIRRVAPVSQISACRITPSPISAWLSSLAVAGTITLLAPASTAFANDSAAVLEAGGLRLVRDVAVEIVSEKLTISPSTIEVDYTFAAADDRGATTLVAFPLPQYDLAWLGPEILGGPGDTVASRSDFKLWINDQQVQPNIEVKALRNGIDVTTFLQGYDIPVDTLDARSLTQALESLSSEAKNQLYKASLIRLQDPYAPEPLWTVQATYYWSQTFPPGQTVHIRHRYTPITGMFFVNDARQLEREVSTHCMSQAEIAGVSNRIAKSPQGAILATQVRYVLTTGANWQGPIQRFQLTVDKEKPENMVVLCFDGLKKTSTTRFEREIQGFVPERDLDVLFFSELPK